MLLGSFRFQAQNILYHTLVAVSTYFRLFLKKFSALRSVARAYSGTGVIVSDRNRLVKGLRGAGVTFFVGFESLFKGHVERLRVSVYTPGHLYKARAPAAADRE